jgi:hypothetical protein
MADPTKEEIQRISKEFLLSRKAELALTRVVLRDDFIELGVDMDTCFLCETPLEIGSKCATDGFVKICIKCHDSLE